MSDFIVFSQKDNRALYLKREDITAVRELGPGLTAVRTDMGEDYEVLADCGDVARRVADKLRHCAETVPLAEEAGRHEWEISASVYLSRDGRTRPISRELAELAFRYMVKSGKPVVSVDDFKSACGDALAQLGKLDGAATFNVRAY